MTARSQGSSGAGVGVTMKVSHEGDLGGTALCFDYCILVVI